MPDKALQPKAAPQCPWCLYSFSVVFGPPPEKDEHGIAYVPQIDATGPLPVTCKCGWSGIAVFLEETD